MSHPAASIKSIFSGKVNLTDPDLVDDYDSTPKDSTYGDLKKENDYDVPDSYAENSSTEYEVQPGDDSYSVSSKNLRIMAMQKGQLYSNFNSSTNISLASSGSDYQQTDIPNDVEYNSDSSQLELNPSDSFSRPVSRNSTTSCLSTTATKDGVEGKKLHRHGPTPYFSSVIANMILHQTASPQPQRGTLSTDLSTASQISGETGRKRVEIESRGPPVTLNEKISLMNADQGAR